MHQKPKQIFILFVYAGLLLLLWPLSVWAANLLSNDMLEAPFVKYGDYTDPFNRHWDLKVAESWEKFIIAQDGDRLRFFSSCDWAAFNNSVFCEKTDGAEAQVIWSAKSFEAGIYQQVSGLTIGKNYGFQGGILQVWETTSSQTDGKMFRSVGIDPYGGIDPSSANVIWSPEEDQDVAWFWPGIGAQAKATTMTVFVRIRSPHDVVTSLTANQVWIDNTFMDEAPTTNLNLTVDSPTQVTATWSGTALSGFALFAYDAQYRKTTDSTWTDLQVFASNVPASTTTSKSFAVESGVEYIVRARTWHEQTPGNGHEVPGPWVEKSVIAGGLVAGKVFDNQNNIMSGVTISLAGTPATNTSSDALGEYYLLTGVGTFNLTATNANGWTSTQPISVTVPNLQTIIPLTLTLAPPDNIVNNGDFENGLTGWQLQGTTPTTTSNRYNGAQSLSLSGTVTISQSDTISNSYQPTLAFWYKTEGSDGNDTFRAEILGATSPGPIIAAVTPNNSFSTTTNSNWQFISLPFTSTAVYTGEVGLRFSLSNGGGSPMTVYVDNVSLGSAQEISKVYLPLILQSN